jgi:hypothetical protein
MDRPLVAWAWIILRLALVLLAIGLLPAFAVQYVLTEWDATIAALLLFSVAPLGVLILAIAIILFLVAWARRPRGPS